MKNEFFLNRLANSSNRFQTDAKRVLTVCSAGLLRSPTAANVLHRLHGYNTRAVGHSEEYALIPIDEVHIEWADEVVCVHPDVKRELDWKFQDSTAYAKVDVVVLAIPDRYSWGDSELEKLIEKQYADSLLVRG